MLVMKLIETWVKAPFLQKASLLIVGQCVEAAYPEVFEEFRKARVVLTSCPEMENAAPLTGKLASMLICSNMKDLAVLTIDGSPHCFTLHAAVNEALFIAKTNTPTRHFVIVGNKAREVSAESVRVGRYLHLAQKCIEKCPEILEELGCLSLEHRAFKSISKAPSSN